MEQWLQAYDACRLIAMNMFSMVDKPFTKEASINLKRVYEISYFQQRIADIIVDLEINYIDDILSKIDSDSEPDEIKATERQLWENIRRVATSSRRTGSGFTGLADMLAALNLKYDSDEALDVVKAVMKQKMKGELDAMIDMAVLQAPFQGWNKDKEAIFTVKGLKGKNSFYQMLLEEFPEQFERMREFGRRNVSWSTVNCGIIE